MFSQAPFPQPLLIDPSLAQQARQRLLLEGELPLGLLRDEIASSWRRCLDNGLRSNKQPELLCLNRGEISVLKERNQLLLNSSLPEMEALSRCFGPSDCLVMLCDANAAILKSLGDQRFLHPTTRQLLSPGATWHEQQGGTNGFGTALQHGKPLLIQGAEHYFDAIAGYTCSSTPIRDPAGKMIGVLDLTSESAQGGRHNLGLVCMAAQLIENRLFIQQYRDQLLIALHRRPEYVDSQWHGLLALDSDGRVLALNREAQRSFGLDSTQEVASLYFEALCGSSLSTFLQHSRRSLKHPVPLTSGERSLHGRLLNSPTPLTLNLGSSGKNTRPASAADAVYGLEQITRDDHAFTAAALKGVKALNHQISLLLLGETGSGKEALAKALHRTSNRSQQPFVALNCAAIPEGLIESELFGYQEGAFTGARRGGMQGKVMQADGGILFLDEIGDMPLDMQARLLRVLQERSITPLGSGKEIAVDIEVICATHRDLKQMVADGGFREDLYYRLNGVTIRIPPLRERANLAGFITHLLQQQSGAPQPIAIDPALLAQFQRYPWPGNVRQLQTVLKTCLAFRDDDAEPITAALLSEDFRQELQACHPALPISTPTLSQTPPQAQAQTLKSAQIEMILAAIDAHQGNISAAAQSLGISRATLYRRLHQAGIELVNERQTQVKGQRG